MHTMCSYQQQHLLVATNSHQHMGQAWILLVGLLSEHLKALLERGHM